MGTWDDYMAYRRRMDQNLLGSSSQQMSDSPTDAGEPSRVPETPTNGQSSTDPADLLTLDQLLRSAGRASLKKLDPRRMNGDGWFEYTKGITKAVKKIVESDFKEVAPNWSTLSSDTKLRWFKAFAQKYNWRYEITTLVQHEFETLCASRLLGYVHEWKKAWKQDKGKPQWMLNSVWIGLIAFWENEKSIKRSKTNSKNKKSDRGGLGIAKHTCGSMPYVRRREEMRDKVTGELPDMVTFMEATHKRKSDGVFVCKKAELIAKKCRNMEHQILSQRDNDDGDTLDTNHLTQEEIDAIYQGEVQVKKGKKFGYGSIPEADPSVDASPNYEEMYLETQEKLQKSDQVIEGMLLKFKDVDFWITMMQNKFPNEVPPSMITTMNTNGGL
ncbi:uncharacterized protein LOC9324239 isoform X2 [Arabidopsis lyrata subsp. lyrata]|nr:uncharacterized protein LOC9324239 isoform X2 [Arabidopsis lyrata subsp. lyrata]|eukprot:XP_020890300.1 uncharacterized protein LOC9324239 isoform X2 [Arabidopsis lyrata subsp. lyrata]